VGVVVGLRKNKPSYLAYKNAIIEWMPEYETTFEHGHKVYKRDDDGNKIEQKYTVEDIYEYNKLGVRVHVKDGDGRPVKIGDVKRSKTRARFAVDELILQPGDQEYDQTKPLGSDFYGQEQYETRKRIIRSKTEKNEDGTYKILREEIQGQDDTKVKDVSYAHELSAVLHQYGLGSATQ
jgi:hypothetical protein